MSPNSGEQGLRPSPKEQACATEFRAGEISQVLRQRGQSGFPGLAADCRTLGQVNGRTPIC
jgi:hypothetical protein